ncbi:nucleoside 2-deoxyribosyltransferase domain-containing protein [Streptomyces diastaticus]|uniref:nucleoside 2-deoxyribosyltransferase domain-containing protein n=1 Tax=Streptomyces diastaticus TaxID=1956 RepID=UPI0033F248E9
MYLEAPTYQPRPTASGPSVFLAGGITNCPDWQQTAAAALADFTVFNPRRRHFPIDDPGQTPVQIAWEYHHLALADLTLFWFPACDPSRTTQPITMYELGAAAATPTRRIVVGADPGYPRTADVHTQLHHARPDLTVHTALRDTLTAAHHTLARL